MTVIEEFLEWVSKQPANVKSYEKIGSAYIRVSTNKQDEYSPIAQLKEIWKYFESHNIYLDPKYIFIEEEGISGKSTSKRNEFNRMIATAKLKPKVFDVLGLWKFSRFARNQEESIVYKSLLRKQCDIDVISISEPLIDGPFGGLIERIIEWMDEYYIINLSGEVKRGMTEKATRGEIQTGASYGYDIDSVNKSLIINEKEAEIVNLIFQKYTVEKLPIIDIARLLYKLNVKTKKNNNFENRTIYYILNNPVYIGKLRWTPTKRIYYDFNNEDSIIVEGKHESLISMDLWKETQKRIKENLKWTKPRQRVEKHIEYWLKGIIRCKECGCTLIKNNKFYLRCNGYSKGRCSNSERLLMQEAENEVINLIKEKMSSGIIDIGKIKRKEKPNNINEITILKSRLEQLEFKRERIKKAYSEGIDTIEEYKTNKLNLASEEVTIKEQITNLSKIEVKKEIESEILENGKKAYEILKDKRISTEKKYYTIHSLVEKVEFDGDIYNLDLYFN